MSSDEEYGWPTVPESLRDLPLILLDVDGTVRGDVLPMVKLAQPLIPNFVGKVLFHEPVNAGKLLRFIWNLARLWTLRTLHSEQRRRYKYVFSELHYLAAAMLHDMPVAEVRRKLDQHLPSIKGLWFEGAVELLRRLTRRAVVVLVTGSEQLQTEQCVRLLADQGLDTRRVLVNGSLYGFDRAEGRFTGGVEQLNVTFDGKMDVVRRYADQHGERIVGAVGNSRPDRALFDAVSPRGMRVLVCHGLVFRKRKSGTFVVRKLARSGYQVYWEPEEFLAAVDIYSPSDETMLRPVLATDSTFANVLRSRVLGEHYPYLA